jgi:CheY-like chemotaxis protein
MKREILLVDDDLAICETLSELLEDDGYRVVTAHDGQEAMNYLLSHPDKPPGLILLDLMMPGMSGMDFLLAYRKETELPSVPVVVLSANTGLCGKDYRSDVLLYLSKPVDVPHLLQTVQTWSA